MISLQPAILAGVASMSTVLNRGAVPPGTYRPTFSIGIIFCQQVTPGVVSIFLSQYVVTHGILRCFHEQA